MLLHDIPREITTPKISERFRAAGAAFMYQNGTQYPARDDYKLRIAVRNGEVDALGWVFLRLTNGTQGWFSSDDVDYWASTRLNHADFFSWDLVERIERI